MDDEGPSGVPVAGWTGSHVHGLDEDDKTSKHSEPSPSRCIEVIEGSERTAKSSFLRLSKGLLLIGSNADVPEPLDMSSVDLLSMLDQLVQCSVTRGRVASCKSPFTGLVQRCEQEMGLDIQGIHGIQELQKLQALQDIQGPIQGMQELQEVDGAYASLMILSLVGICRRCFYEGQV